MPESPEQKIARLMAEGLDYYGQDQIEDAVQCWREVLGLEPNHRVALDYLDAAGYQPDAAPTEPPPPVPVSMRETADAHLQAEEWSEAMEALSIHVLTEPGDLDAQAKLDLLRSHLYGRHRAAVGDGSGVANVKLSPGEILKFNLPANAGFVLSMIDGNTSVNDLVTLTGMDPFEALHVFTRLMDAGIVEVQA